MLKVKISFRRSFRGRVRSWRINSMRSRRGRSPTSQGSPASSGSEVSRSKNFRGSRDSRSSALAAGQDADGNDVAYLYNWDGSGTEGDDLYFNVSYNGETYTFTVESYLCDKTTDVYKAVQSLEIGQTVDMEGFLYWYEGVNPHITSLTVVK